MSIRVTCACGKVYIFKDEVAGRRAKCPACGHIVEIPLQATPAKANSSLTMPQPRQRHGRKFVAWGGAGIGVSILVACTYLFINSLCGFKVVEQKLGPLSMHDQEVSSSSSGGCHVAMASRVEGKLRISVDGQPESENIYDEVCVCGVFSADGKHLAYTAKKGSQWCVVLDGNAGPGYEEIFDIDPGLIFSPDSKHLAYFAKKGNNKWCVVLDGHAGPSYDGTFFFKRGLVFSPDSKHYAYPARLGDRVFVVLDGRPGLGHDSILPLGMPVFSSDSMHMAYIGDGRIVFDGQFRNTLYPAMGGLVLSSGGVRLAYEAKKGGKLLWVVDDRPGPEFDAVLPLVFSPDGKHYAYEGYNGHMDYVDGKLVFPRCSMVVDGIAGAVYDSVGEPVFSHNGTRLAYYAYAKDKSFVVLDGQPTQYDSVEEKTLRFSPDDKRFVFVASEGDKWFVVENGQPGQKFDRVYCPHFSADSRHLGYSAHTGTKEQLSLLPGSKPGRIEQIVLDGRVGAQHEGMWPGEFSEDRQFGGHNT